MYTVHVSYMEIYNEEIRDLLSGDQSKKLEIKGQHGVVAGDFDRYFISVTLRWEILWSMFVQKLINMYSSMLYSMP